MAPPRLEQLLNQLSPDDVWLVRVCMLAVVNEDWLTGGSLSCYLDYTREALSQVIDFFGLTRHRVPGLTDEDIVDATIACLGTVHWWMWRTHSARTRWIDASPEDVADLYTRLTT